MLATQIPVPEALPDTFRAVDLCGVLLNGILGGLIARRSGIDPGVGGISEPVFGRGSGAPPRITAPAE